MSLKIKNLILFSCILILSNITYFLWMPFPKSFLKSMGSNLFITDIISNLLYFTCFSIVIIVCVKSAPNKLIILTKKEYFTAILTCICIQITNDLLKLLLTPFLRLYSYLFYDLMCVICWTITIIILCKVIGIKKINYKKFCLIYTPIIIVLFIVFFILDMKTIADINYATSKYNALSYEYNINLINNNFRYEIRNAALDALVGISIMIALYFSLANKEQVNNARKKLDVKLLLIRILCAFLLCFGFSSVKYLVLRPNSLSNTSGGGIHSWSTEFAKNISTIENYRFSDYINTYKVCCISKVKICYANKKLIKFYMDGDSSNCDNEKLNKELIGDNFLDGITSDITNVTVYYNKAVSYIKDDIPYAIKISDLPSKEYNIALLQLSKNMLEQSKLDCFEYTCEYVMKYDPEFAKPYIERYKAGNFTASEYENDMNINTDYITAQANRISQKYIQGE